jgi:signal transduction histidine kinase
MKRSILYVDDELDNLLVFEAAFEDHFTIFTANSGKEALEILEKDPIPVVVADQRMPGMSGAELFGAIRQRSPQTKRILLTGYTDPDDMASAINDGQIFHFVKKPWDRSFLFSIFVRAFQSYDLEIENSSLMNKLIISERCAILGRAMSRIAHEMGNLVCIVPLLEAIEDDYSDDQELMELSRLTRETCDRLNGLIGEVKDFVKFDQGSFPKVPVPLSEVVYQLLPFLRYDDSIPDDKFQFELKTDATVLANKIKLQQVLHNLVKNAADATRDVPNGRISLVVDASDSEGVITVTDNGSGVPPEIMGRIWEPFFTTKGDAGNGIGLDVSRRLIESHKGVINCRSAVNKGTTFEIRLPKFEFPSPTDEQPVVARSFEQPPAPAFVTQNG